MRSESKCISSATPRLAHARNRALLTSFQPLPPPRARSGFARRLLLKHAKLDDRQIDEDGNELPEDEANAAGLQLTQFEMAQLANLCITEVDEAKALIPTLATRDDALLDSLLQELDNIRRFS